MWIIAEVGIYFGILLNMKSATVKRAPVYWKYLLYFSKVRGLLFITTIYLRADIYDDLYSTDPKAHSVGILIHEQTHFNRMQQQGMVKFGMKYLFSAKGRFEEELAAISEQMKYLKKNGEKYDIERMSGALSSWYYLWSAPYDIAYSRLSEQWNSI
jgi:hypothetical protein